MAELRPIVFCPAAYTGRHKLLWLLPERWHAYIVARDVYASLPEGTLTDAQDYIIGLPAGSWKVTPAKGWRRWFFRFTVTPYTQRFHVQS